MTVAVLVGCGKAKRVTNGPTPAKLLYTSGYAGKKARYAALRADRGWSVLSAKYGVVGSATPIETYDARLGDDVDLEPWARRVMRDLGLADRVAGIEPDPATTPAPICRADTLEILAGRDYVDPLRDAGLPAAFDGAVRFPFQEEPDAAGGFGYQIGWLTDEIERLDATPEAVI